MIDLPHDSLVRTRSGIVYFYFGRGFWLDENGHVTQDFVFLAEMHRAVASGYALLL